MADNITPNLLTNSQTIYALTVSLGLAPATHTNNQTFYPPTLSLGITPGLFINSQTFFGNIAQERRPQRARTRIRRTRHVLDLYRNQHYVVETVHPSGRATTKAKAATRRRAFEKARKVARAQTSPTAAAGGAFTPDGVLPEWQHNIFLAAAY